MKKLIYILIAGVMLACWSGCSQSGNDDEPQPEVQPGHKGASTFDYTHPEYVDGKSLTVDSARQLGLYCLEAPSDGYMRPAFEQDTIYLHMTPGDSLSLTPFMPTEITMVYRWDGEKLYIHSKTRPDKPFIGGPLWFYWPQKFEWSGIEIDNSNMQNISLKCLSNNPGEPVCIYVERLSNAYIPYLLSDANILVIYNDEEALKKTDDMIARITELQRAFNDDLAGSSDGHFDEILSTWGVVD